MDEKKNLENNGIYTQEENNILEKIQSDLLKMADNIITNSDPKSKSYKSDVRVVNEVYQSVSKNINDAAANRLKHAENNNKEATLDMVAEVIKSVANRRLENKLTERYLDAPDEIVPDDVVPGEMEIGPDKLDIGDFITTKD